MATCGFFLSLGVLLVGPPPPTSLILQISPCPPSPALLARILPTYSKRLPLSCMAHSWCDIRTWAMVPQSQDQCCPFPLLASCPGLRPHLQSSAASSNESGVLGMHFKIPGNAGQALQGEKEAV